MPTPLSRCIHHSGNISAVGRWCFRSLRAPRLVRWRKVNFHPQDLCHHRVLRELFAWPGVMRVAPDFPAACSSPYSLRPPSFHATRAQRQVAVFPLGQRHHYRSAGNLDDVVSLPVAQQFPRFCDCRALRSCSLAKSPRAGAPLYRHFLPGWRS